MGRYDEAERFIRAALASYAERAPSDPRRKVAWMLLGNVLLNTKRYAEADEAFAQALAIDPAQPIPWFNRAINEHWWSKSEK